MLTIPDEALFDAPSRRPPPSSSPTDPCLITFTSGTTGEPKGIVHGQRYLPGQRLQAEHWLDARAGRPRLVHGGQRLVEVGAQRVHRAVDPRRRRAAARRPLRSRTSGSRSSPRESVNVLCMAPTEYRVIAKRAELKPLPALRELVAAGEALNPEVLRAFEEATGLEIRDGYGQTETGPAHRRCRPASRRGPGRWAGRCPGVDADGRATASSCSADPTHRPDVLRRLPRRRARARGPALAHRRPRQPDEDGYLYFEGRTDDVIISAGYRIGPFEVESALVSHPAVAEAAVVAAPDDERGAVVRAVVVLRDGFAPSDDARRRAPGPRQARDRAVQVPADRRVRRRAAEDRERQGPARGCSATAEPSLALDVR